MTKVQQVLGISFVVMVLALAPRLAPSGPTVVFDNVQIAAHCSPDDLHTTRQYFNETVARLEEEDPPDTTAPPITYTVTGLGGFDCRHFSVLGSFELLHYQDLALKVTRPRRYANR